ncbi:L-amino-acid oxidase [Fulvia fulva]|uniref:L-amino-acid oxidase n=1 Tax=Passalora fulva TaxID=5499 RepID=A0A9Q8LJD0_PASFU|nr:L-amino-acid oxidase [Fulvia fulva]KAK4623528.1 L-amino-acid oxidase [Fulvia fulva]KAK4625224.1 L-amino-acid oxidase [Fulvia fulva]UJO18219.1 L-amino-acid oxidase [Fulvia fulva]WPV14581.1 L-amino-acid oxidase [Fulvia fulva]WPV30344.1 L-amino-acid oxidase [Fulvia fulva]
MVRRSRLSAASLAALVSSSSAGSVVPRSATVSFQNGILAEAGGMHNLSLHYGACEAARPDDCHHSLGSTFVGSHPLGKRHEAHPSQRPTKFVWLPPADITDGGCLQVYSGNVLVGRSEPVTVGGRKTKRWQAAAEIMDAEGPWFEGVEYLKAKKPGDVFVAAAKSKKIGIIGGGMSGLMTAHLLDSVGFYDWKIVEASSRVGGRVHTSYLNGTTPDQYQYQEMGPMRFPVSITYDDPAETIQINDHRMVFQLADVLNKQNGNASEYKVNFIKWIQSAVNDPSASATSNATYSNATAVAEAEAAYDRWADMDRDAIRAMAFNVYTAHKWVVDNGYFHFSEAEYLKYAMGLSNNLTDEVDSSLDNSPVWEYDTGYFAATEWRTIDQELSRLPAAFGPQVYNRTYFQTAVSGMSWDAETEKVTVQYRNHSKIAMEPDTMDFDYAVVAVPFSKVRLWRLPEYTSLLSRAISRLNYDQSCKIALHYKTRFWEHLPEPIIGGCGSTDIPMVGSICYPSYQINSTRPGVILGSYISTNDARSVGSMTEEDHVALVQRAMVEIHGEVAAEQWTGNYDRKCWEFDEYQAGAWADPLVGQQELYLPAYFQTEKHTVFVGEHTSYTHAWIWSALESAVRGTTQLLLDMGLVDEAKEITEFWMARWIEL